MWLKLLKRTTWECFSRYNVGGRVGTEVGEEKTEAVNEKEQRRCLFQLLIEIAHKGKNQRDTNESNHLDRFAPHAIDKRNGGPIAWQSNGSDHHRGKSSITNLLFRSASAI